VAIVADDGDVAGFFHGAISVGDDGASGGGGGVGIATFANAVIEEEAVGDGIGDGGGAEGHAAAAVV